MKHGHILSSNLDERQSEVAACILLTTTIEHVTKSLIHALTAAEPQADLIESLLLCAQALWSADMIIGEGRFPSTEEGIAYIRSLKSGENGQLTDKVGDLLKLRESAPRGQRH